MDKVNILKETQEIIQPISRGDLVEGIVIGFGRSSIFLDLSPHGSGIIYGQELYSVKSALKDLKIGDKIAGEVISSEDRDGYKEISVKKAIRNKTWERLQKAKEEKEAIEVTVFGANRGGLLTKIEDIPAFIPASQLAIEHFPRVQNAEKSEILLKLKELVGETLKIKILNIDQQEEKLILSEKLEELEKTKQNLEKYKVDDIVEGEITGLADFGAFISFGEKNLEGLIHISELDWGLVKSPQDIVKIGEKVKAKIINIEKDRVSLSLKAMRKKSSDEKK
jgi:small subunit ribosomal protein S1